MWACVYMWELLRIKVFSIKNPPKILNPGSGSAQQSERINTLCGCCVAKVYYRKIDRMSCWWLPLLLLWLVLRIYKRQNIVILKYGFPPKSHDLWNLVACVLFPPPTPFCLGTLMFWALCSLSLSLLFSRVFMLCFSWTIININHPFTHLPLSLFPQTLLRKAAFVCL